MHFFWSQHTPNFFLCFFASIVINLFFFSPSLAETPSHTNEPPAKEHTHPDPEKELEPLVCDTTPQGLTLLVTGLGLNESLTERAIAELPKEIALSFSAYATMINQWTSLAKAAGHQIFIELGSEKDLNNTGILAYFDGVLLIPEKPPVTDPKILENFVYSLGVRKKMILEGRLFPKDLLALEAQKQKAPFRKIQYSLSEASLFEGKQDIFELKGIVTFPVSFLNYLIDMLKAQKNLSLIPLTL